MKEIFPIIFLIFSSCSSSLRQEDCESLDWKRQGKRDAAQGLSITMFKTYKINCLENLPHTDQQALYKDGYQSGLKNYCNYRTGFLLGDSNSLLNPNCDVSIFPEFLKGHKAGQISGKKKALQEKGPKTN